MGAFFEEKMHSEESSINVKLNIWIIRLLNFGINFAAFILSIYAVKSCNFVKRYQLSTDLDMKVSEFGMRYFQVQKSEKYYICIPYTFKTNAIMTSQYQH